MKSCIEWRAGFKYLPQIDEFNINFKSEKGKKLINFLDKYAISQKVNIRIDINTVSQNDIELINAIYTERKYNIALCIKGKNEEKFLKLIKNNIEIPYYFFEPAFTWEELYYYIELGAKEAFISNWLGFELDQIVKVFPDLKIRCYLNITQPSFGGGFKEFYIRPEDIDIYSDFVDVGEFYDSVDKQNILYEIYFKDKEWNGNLQEIIQGLNVSIDNYYIVSEEFAKTRVSCGRKCLKGKRCYMCDRIFELAKSLENNSDYEVFKRS